jgi:RimJ/RimL family protein N-acetyltransferase
MQHVHELETQRLRLRQWRPEDLAPFAALNADPAVMEFFPEPLTQERSDASAQKMAALIAEHGWGFWAAELRSSGAFLGLVGLHRPRYELPCGPCVEVGWRLGREHWGHGYATEGAQACLAFGFGPLALKEVVAFTAVHNRRSHAVMERLGMHADVLFDHPAIPEDSAVRAHVMYRIDRAAWTSAQGG